MDERVLRYGTHDSSTTFCAKSRILSYGVCVSLVLLRVIGGMMGMIGMRGRRVMRYG